MIDLKKYLSDLKYVYDFIILYVGIFPFKIGYKVKVNYESFFGLALMIV